MFLIEENVPPQPAYTLVSRYSFCNLVVYLILCSIGTTQYAQASEVSGQATVAPDTLISTHAGIEGELRESAVAQFDGDIGNNLAHRSAPSNRDRTQGEIVITLEDFEGGFPPTGWAVHAQGFSDVTWGRSGSRSASGTYSAWSAGSQSVGLTYPNNMSAWLVYGPFDLSDAMSAQLEFSYWNRSERNYDFFGWYYSSNGVNFSGTRVSGDSGGWRDVSERIDDIGSSQVWIAFIFESDNSIADVGAFLDDVTIRKTLAPEPPVIAITPSTISTGAATGDTSTADLYIANQGGSDLNWSIGAVESAEVPAVDLAMIASTVPSSSTGRASVAASLRRLLQERDKVQVLVEMNVPFSPAQFALGAATMAQHRQVVEETRKDILTTAATTSAIEYRRFSHVPFLALEVDEEALDLLSSHPLVRALHEDEPVPPLLTTSTELIGSALAVAQGHDGTGQAVVVLDTGVDSSHPFFGDRTVAEACFSTTNISLGASSLCPNGVTEQIGPGSGVNCTNGLAGCDHGTHVAGIAVGSGPGFSGVAPGADLVAIQVFSRFVGDSSCGVGQSPCIMSFTSDQIKALEHIYDLSGQYDIASVNMSLGGSKYSNAATCDIQSAATKSAIDLLRSIGIATVIASGNDGYSDGISSPACISSAIAVGSTTKSDGVSSFSNVNQLIHLFAPGSEIVSAVPGSGYASMSGTSMAAPHVAGAYAILRAANPDVTFDQLLYRLQSTGRPIVDLRNGITRSRIQVDDAVAPDASWIAFSSTSGVVPSGDTQTLEISFDASKLSIGTYSAFLRVISNDPDHSVIHIPVDIDVVDGSECGIRWQAEINIDAATGGVRRLVLGQGSLATDGIDEACGEDELAPPPPSEVFDARFRLPGSSIDSERDFRSDRDDRVEWRLSLQPGDDGSPLTLTWDTTAFPDDIFRLSDGGDGSFVHINMKAVDNYTVSDPSLRSLYIVRNPRICIPVALKQGWNMVSVPVHASEMEVASLFPPSGSDSAYEYGDQYTPTKVLEPGKGYWLRSDSTQILNICGAPTDSRDVDVVAGWNLVGTYDLEMSTNSVWSEPADIVRRFYSYADRYEISSLLTPGQGYWVRTSDHGTIRFDRNNSPSTAPALATASVVEPWTIVRFEDATGITVTLRLSPGNHELDDFDLPPLPPAGIPDVRFSTNRDAAHLVESNDVRLSSMEYPVRIWVEQLPSGVLNVSDGYNGSLYDAQLSEGVTIEITQPLERLQFSYEGPTVPATFALGQSHPNPASQSARIHYDLPESAHVRLLMYDLVGSLVSTIVDEPRAAGSHNVEVDVREFASGVYVYVMMVDGFREVKRMVVIR